MIFCYTELLFPRHSESDRTLLSSRLTAQSVYENILKKFSATISQECNCSDPKSKKYLRKKMSVMEVALFSATLKTSSASSVSNNFAWLLNKQSTKMQCLAKLFRVLIKLISKTFSKANPCPFVDLLVHSSLPAVHRQTSILFEVLIKSISEGFTK